MSRSFYSFSTGNPRLLLPDTRHRPPCHPLPMPVLPAVVVPVALSPHLALRRPSHRSLHQSSLALLILSGSFPAKAARKTPAALSIVWTCSLVILSFNSSLVLSAV